ncbi:MAG: 16S rRNA (cytosine(967)-C(5))-methyltransferase RsmB [Pseudomonadota bacterium]
MSRSAAVRAAAAKAVSAVMRQGRSLDDARAEQLTKLADVDQARFSALCFGTLRHARAVEWLLSRLVAKPLPAKEYQASALLCVGLYELWHMRTPDHAVVSESVNAMMRIKRPRLRGLCNAVLRRFVREREALLAELANQSLAVQTSHPDWLAQSLAKDWPDHFETLLQQNNERAPMWLRVNTQRQSVADYQQALALLDIKAEASAAAPQALRLAEPIAVERLPGFADGVVSVQDLSPQRVAPLCNVQPGMRVLDACSAPGGKAAHLLELVDGDLELLALDLDETRLTRVTETFERLRYRGQTALADASTPEAWWDGKPFDCVLIDAPCSATGVIRRHPDIKTLRRATDIAALVERQHRLLAALAPLVAEGGCLVYATCSVLKAENHEVIREFSQNHRNFAFDQQLRDDNNNGLMISDSSGSQCLPDALSGDGFFVSRLQKTAA